MGDDQWSDGGESACYAHLLCPECGAVMGDSHAEACPSRSAPAAEDWRDDAP